MMNYRNDIDGLRAIAVLSVVLFHAFPASIPGGFIGVDVFFVLSGFLISNILFYQIADGSISWSSFYLNRVKRIFPALLVVLLSAVVLGYFLLFPDEYENLGKHILGSSAFLNNFVLWRDAGYFDKASELKPLLHLWSLGIEEQFYLIWPLFIYLIWKLRFNVIAVLIAFSLFSFLVNLSWINHHSVIAFYWPIPRFWELGVGGLLAYLMYHNLAKTSEKPELTTKRYIMCNVISFASLVFLVIGILFFNQKLTYPGWPALLPILCTITLLSTPDSWINRKLLTLPALTFIGLISYPLYLWHWELLSFARIIYSGVTPFMLIISLVLLSFVLAWLTYIFIEKPIRFTLKGKRYQKYIALGLCLSLIMVGFFGFIIKNKHGFVNRQLAQQQNILLNDIKGFDKYREQIVSCELSQQHPELKQLTSCLQTKKGQPNKVIWGDSHAEHLFPGMSKLDQKNNWLLLEYTGCPPLLNVASYWKGSADKCIQANKNILNAILDAPSIDTVVLASLGPFYISDDSYAAASHGEFAASKHFLEHATIKTSKGQAFYDGFSETIKMLKKAGKKVILFQDTPEIPFMPERCIGRPLAPQQSCVLKENEVITRQKNYALIMNRLRRENNILLYDPLSLVCNKGSCPLIMNNHLIYRDSHHLSIAGSELIAEKFVPWINKNID